MKTENNTNKINIKTIIKFLELKISESQFEEWLKVNNIDKNPEIKTEKLRGITKSYLYGYKQNEDTFEDSVSESQSYSTFRVKKSPSRISTKSPINQKGNSENSNEKLDMLFIIVKNRKENEQLIENIVRNPEIIVELLRGKYVGMDFKITCRKSDSR